SHLRNEEELRSTDTNEIPIVKKKNGRISTDPRDPDVARAVKREQAEAHKANKIRKRWMRIGVAFAILVICSIVASGAYLVYSWTQKQYYIGKGNDRVVIYQGVPTNIFGLELSHQIEETDIRVKKLDKSWQDQLDEGISFSSLKEARGH
ncbi:phosphoprotein phosphatase, partial [Gardnerella vaginalis]